MTSDGGTRRVGRTFRPSSSAGTERPPGGRSRPGRIGRRYRRSRFADHSRGVLLRVSRAHASEARSESSRGCTLRRLAVGARRRAHRPAVRPFPGPPGCCAAPPLAMREWVASARRPRLRAGRRASTRSPLVASGSTAERSGLNAQPTDRTPPKPAPLVAAVPVPGPTFETFWSFGRSSPKSPSSLTPSYHPACPATRGLSGRSRGA
jgi:hypothetical protein